MNLSKLNLAHLTTHQMADLKNFNSPAFPVSPVAPLAVHSTHAFLQNHGHSEPVVLQ